MAISRSIRRVDFRLAVAVVWLAALAAPALAAEVLDTRLGVHGDYTRIVFELDSPAGYQIHREEGESGSVELWVSLDATASAQTLSSPKSDVISGVELEPTASGSIARIRLTTAKVRLKEMILANPARIVLDVMLTEVSAAPAPMAIPDLSTPEPAQKIVDALEADEPVPSAMDDAAPAAPAPGGMVPSTPSNSAPQHLAMATKRAPAAAPPVRQMQRPEPRPLPRAPRKLPPAPASAPKPAAGSSMFGLDLTTVGLAAVGLIGLVAAGGLMMRRRGRAEETEEGSNPFDNEDSFTDFSAAPESASSSAAAPTEMISVDDDDLPAPLTDDAPVVKGVDSPETNRLAPLAPMGVESKVESTQPDPNESSSVDFFGSADTEVGAAIPEPADASNDDDAPAATVVMDVPDLPGNENDTLLQASAESDSPGEDSVSNFDTVAILEPEASPGFSVPAEAASSPGQIQELERRVVSAETRLDEALEAAERMERKIAAQTEELRVQRAAIARTQRAVRNLTRPDEESGPTEPALREPHKKGSSPD